jgi:hypothetical protein
MDIKTAIEKGEDLRSKIPKDYYAKLTGGLGSPKIWHTLNNLCAESDTYLEIGTYMGASLMAALYGNDVKAYAVDNFCMKPNTRNHFFQNVKELTFTFIEKDCFKIQPSEIPDKIGLYFFDGEHTEAAQYKALTHFLPMMKDEFVYVCDDYNNKPVQEGTINAIRDLGLKVVEHEQRTGAFTKDRAGWWCGISIFKLRKP